MPVVRHANNDGDISIKQEKISFLCATAIEKEHLQGSLSSENLQVVPKRLLNFSSTQLTISTTLNV